MTKNRTPPSRLRFFDFGNLPTSTGERSKLYIKPSPTPYKSSKLYDFIVSWAPVVISIYIYAAKKCSPECLHVPSNTCGINFMISIE